MPFSAATCLTYTGTTTLGSTLEVYVDSDSYASLFTTVSLNDITTNCPYYFLNVPDGTNNIKLFDPVSCCYCIIPVQSNDLCTTCELNFNTYSATTIGQIVAGNLTGSCEENITDYIVYWYESGDPLNPVFTSGYGTEFQPYDYIHPLTGSSSVLVPSGIYEPIIDKVVISGITFSQTGGTGTIPANLDCLPTFTVEALTCINGNGSSDLPQYEHKFEFSATTGGGLPIPLNTTFELSAGTKYFPFKFRGFAVPDKLKLTLVSSSYSEPIVLDYWVVGDNLSGNNGIPSAFPKSADTSGFFSKVVCLTGFTINNGDNILIEVTPSTANTQTSWTYYCGCLDEVNCFECDPPSGTTVSGNTSYQYPISASTIGITATTCDRVNISFRIVQTCDYSLFTASTEYNYMNASGSGIINGSSTLAQFSNLYLSNTSCGFQYTGSTPTISCVNYGPGTTITYEKSVGNFKITSDNLSVISTQYNWYLSNIVPYISSFSGDNTNIGFYRYFNVYYPNSTGTTPCGDGTIQKQLRLHQSSVISTGITGSDYYINFTMPTISNGTSFTSCELNCTSFTNSVVSQVNSDSTGTTNNYTGTTTVGSSYNYMVFAMRLVTSDVTSATGASTSRSISLQNTFNETYPASGTSYTLIPSLSSVTCSNISSMYYPSNSNTTYGKFLAYYQVELYDPLDNQNFKIYAFSIDSNGNVNLSTKTLIYEYSGGVGTILYSDYFV